MLKSFKVNKFDIDRINLNDAISVEFITIVDERI